MPISTLVALTLGTLVGADAAASSPVCVAARPAIVRSAVALPEYPARSRRLRETGTVHIRVQVGEDGSIGEPYVARSSGFPLLDQAAADWVGNWTFSPLITCGGAPMKAWVEVPVTFQLE